MPLSSIIKGIGKKEVNFSGGSGGSQTLSKSMNNPAQQMAIMWQLIATVNCNPPTHLQHTYKHIN